MKCRGIKKMPVFHNFYIYLLDNKEPMFYIINCSFI